MPKKAKFCPKCLINVELHPKGRCPKWAAPSSKPKGDPDGLRRTVLSDLSLAIALLRNCVNRLSSKE